MSRELPDGTRTVREWRVRTPRGHVLPVRVDDAGGMAVHTVLAGDMSVGGRGRTE